MTLSITKTNVRYITGSSKKEAGKVVSIKFRVFGETKEIVELVSSKLKKLKETGINGKLTIPKYNGWNLKKNVFFREFITKDRKEFQDAFKTAKRGLIETSRKALEVALEAKEKVEKAKK